MIAKYSINDMLFYISLEKSKGDLDVIRKRGTLCADLHGQNGFPIGKSFCFGVYDSQRDDLNISMSPTGCDWESVRHVLAYVPLRISRTITMQNFGKIVLRDDPFRAKIEFLAED